MLFHELKIGDKFHDGKGYGMGVHSKTLMWEEYEKISPSKAKRIGQFGYGNTNLVGGMKSFGAQSRVWLLEN